MNNLLFEIIVTNQCNKRCSYCDLDFRTIFIDKKYIDNLYDILISNSSKIDNLTINFFGWEPLLNFEIIKYSIEKFSVFKNIKFCVWTNWVLLSEKYFNFLQKNKVHIYLSIDCENYKILEEKKFLKNYDFLFVNLIFEPGKIEKFYWIFENFILWYGNINFMPVYTTQKWNIKSLTFLYKIFEKYHKTWNFFNYYNWFSSEKQFILETNGELFQDLDSLLWLQKQYKIFPKKISNFISEKTKIWNIENLQFEKIIEYYNENEIRKLVFLLEKFSKSEKNNELIKLIFSKKLTSNFKKILLFLEFLKQNFIENSNNLEKIFSSILQDCSRNNYYKNSLDNQLFDCSIEYDSQKWLQKYFKFSYFWTNIEFAKQIFSYFWYKKSLEKIEKDYAFYQKFLKDNTITIGFKLENWKLEELKIYFDLVKSEELFLLEQIDLGINADIVLKSYTFVNDETIENKIYIPPDEQSFLKAKNILSKNENFLDFEKYNYYDILYRYEKNFLKTVKFYYNLEENKDLISKMYQYFWEKIFIDFWVLNVKRELWVDFIPDWWIKKYSLYFWLYK